MKDVIEKYIHSNAGPQVIQRGKGLYYSLKVSNLKYDLQKRSASANVRGTSMYSVKIRLSNDPSSMDSFCSCPYDFGGICKHEVAVLLTLQALLPNQVLDEEDKDPSLQILDEPSGVLIADYRKPVLEIISQYEEESDYESFQFLPNVKFQKFIPDKSLTIVTEITSYYDDSEINYIEFSKQKDGVLVECDCGDCFAYFCEHATSALRYVATLNDEFLRLLDKEYSDALLHSVLEGYAISFKKDQLDKYITFQVEDGILEPKMKENYGALVPVKGKRLEMYLNQMQSRLDSSSSDDFLLSRETLRLQKNVNRGYGVVIYADDTPLHSTYQISGITGKLSKNRKNLISSFLELEEDPDVNLSLHQKRIQDAVNSLKHVVELYEEDHSESELAYCRDVLPEFKNLFNCTTEEDFTYVANKVDYWDSSIRKNDLDKVSFNQHPARLVIKCVEDKKVIEARPYLICNDLTYEVNQEFLADHRFGPVMILVKMQLFLIENLATFSALNFFKANELRAVKSEQKVFIENYLLPFSSNFEIDLSNIKNLAVQPAASETPIPKVFLSGIGDHIMFRLFVAYADDMEQNILEKGSKIISNNGQLVKIDRNPDFEEQFEQTIRELHPKFGKQYPEQFYHLSIEDMIADFWFLDAFETLSAKSIEVYGLNDLKNFKYKPARARVSTGITSGVDWFDVQVEVAFGDTKVSLSKVKKAILNKDNYIKLDDGTIGVLPKEWIERFERIFRQGEIKGDTVKISNRKIMIIDSLFGQINNEDIHRQLAEKRQKIREFSSIKNVRKPKGIRADLRGYQKEGLNWLNFLDEFEWGGILADDMGLGKTLQILTFLVQQKANGTNLIVVPTTLIFNWENEIQKFCPTLKAHYYYGGNREKDHSIFKKYDVVITTYGLIVNDIEVLSKFTFNYIVLDESQAIKNPVSKRFKAACLLKGKNKLAMTGTPIENNTFDLFAQMQFVNPGLLGSTKTFKDNYSQPIDKDGNAVVAQELKELINPFIIRRTKEQVATELPPKTEEVLYCEMEKEQRKVYDAYRNKYRDALMGRIEDDGLEKSKIYVLEGLMKLRQICDSPGILSDEENYGSQSIKIEELTRNIREKTGEHKIVVFSQFVSMLKLIEKRIKEEGFSYEYLDGQSSKKHRQESVTRFQEDAHCRVFLISLKAGGTGLNLTAADYVFIVDPWWNPAVESQAIDRCYRIGQDKKVFAYRMICKNTIEEKILEYQQRKKAVASDIIQAEESFMKQLTQDDIKGLFE